MNFFAVGRSAECPSDANAGTVIFVKVPNSALFTVFLPFSFYNANDLYLNANDLYL